LFKRWWLILIAVFLILPSVIGDLIKGTLDSISIVGLSAIAILILRFGISWFRALRFIDQWIQQQGDNPITYDLDPETITAESQIGKTTLKWNAFKRLTITPFHILIEFKSTPGALTLPTEQAAPELIDYLTERFRENGLVIDSK
jgi:hypothetical protein